MSSSYFYLILLLPILFIDSGESVRCYECSSRLGPGETDACLYGDQYYLKRVTCVGPSVCAAYHYQSSSYVHHVTRGCQAIRFGSTCEDIFHELRAHNEILPGQHTCTTCSSDFCNSSYCVKSSNILFISILLVLSSYLIYM